MRDLAKARGARVPGRRGHGYDRVPGDRIERQPERADLRWERWLVRFMRLVALLWVAKGIQAWAVILGILPEAVPFEAERLGRQAATVYFGVIDPMAGVGLWLAGAWGGVIWLLAATSFLILALLMPAIVPVPLVAAVGAGILVAVYLVLSWFAANEA